MINISRFSSLLVSKCRAVVYGSELSKAVSDIFQLLVNGSTSFPSFVTGRDSGKVEVPGARDLDTLAALQVSLLGSTCAVL